MADFSYQILIDGLPDADLLGNLIDIEVSESLSSATTCRARFSLDIAGGKWKFLDDERLMPGSDHLLTVIILVGNESNVISHGLITDRRIQLADGGPGSSLELWTSDRRVLMDRTCRASGSRNGPVFGIVSQILVQYGFIPLVDVKYSALYTELTQALNQAGSDLALIQALAGQHDAYFWLDWTIPGKVIGPVIETAHFEPSPKGNGGGGFSLPVSIPFLPSAPVLQMNTGSGKSTINKFSAEWMSEAPNRSGPIARVDIDAGRLERGRVGEPTVRRLGDAPPTPTIECQVLSPGNLSEAERRQTAALNDASWVIRASADTSVHALGALVRPHETIEVQGVGAVDSGEYFVEAVRHRVSRSDHLMNVQLRRNAISSSGFGLGGF